jgi:hypothetical protein
MIRAARTRFWLEVALATLGAALFLITWLLPDWIEVAFKTDPDRSSGAVELLITSVALATAVGFGVLARLEWRHWQTARE